MPEANPRTEALFWSALAIASPEERARYLDQRCAGDQQLRGRVEELLTAYPKVEGFLEPPAPSPVVTVDKPPAGTGAGALIGPYKLLEQLGEGGMGTVWMAQQTEPVKRLVAVKLIKAGMDSAQVIARFEAERQALALMDHPNIARVLDAGTTPGGPDGVRSGRPYFVMDLVKGVPITRYCDEHRLTPRQRLELFLPVCRAVQHAHQKGIIHRDLKPSNVLVALYDGKPVPKVIDFGVAKAAGQPLTEKTLVTGFGAIVGTLEYMSPEQAELNQLDIDTRSDIYALGVLLYELLAGSPPFTRKEAGPGGVLEMLRVIREQEPTRPSAKMSTAEGLPTLAANRGTEPAKLTKLVRGELDWIVMKALEKDRSRRYETANGFARDVQRYLADEPVLACPPSAWYRFRKFARRNKGRLAVAAGVFLAVTVIAATIGWAVRDRAARRAEVERRAHDSLTAARSLIAENKLAAARQKLAEARAHLGTDRSALASLAAGVKAAEADLDRWQKFLDLIDRARQAETAPVLEPALAAGGSPGRAATRPPARVAERRPAAAVPFLLEALHCYEVLERDDWNRNLEGGLLGRDQVEQIRRTVYEELLGLAEDVVVRREEHRSGNKLSPQGAARAALVYLGKAESAHRATQAFYALRARCHKALGEKAAALADQRRADKTAPTLALDHYLRGQAAYYAKRRAEGIQAFEAGLRLEPTHYWCLMRLGYCLCDLGRGPEDFAKAALVFTGCILKRPDHAHAYFCRGHAYRNLGRHDKSIGEYQKAIQLEKDYELAHYCLGNALYAKGRLDEAITAFREAIRLKKDFFEAHTTLGNALGKKGRLDAAIAAYRKAIRLKKDDPVAHFNLGLALYKKGRLDAAIAAYREAIRLKEDDPEAHFMLGQALHKKGRPDEAIAAYRKAIRLKEDYPEAHGKLGIALKDTGLLDEAIAEYRTAICLKKDETAPHTNLGNALADKGCLNEAMAEFQEAIRLQEANPEKKANPEPHNGLGNVLEKKGRLDEAIAAYRKAIRLKKDFAEAHYNLGNALVKMRRLDEAIAAFRKAVRFKKGFAEAYHDLATALEAKGRLDEAITAYRKAIRLKPHLAKTHTNLGNALRAKGDLTGAIAAYSKAIELDPKSANAWYNRGAVYCDSLGRPDKALGDFSEAIKLVPKAAYAWHYRGNAYFKLGQFDKAAADYTQAIKLEPKIANAWYSRGLACAKLGQFDKAVADFSQAIHLNPKFVNAWYDRGFAYAKLGQPGKAVADFSRAIKLDPKNAAAWISRGTVHYRLGQRGKAVADYSRAIKLDPKNAAARYYRGNVYQELGQLGKAVADFSRAIKLDPKNKGAWNNRGYAYRKLGQPAKAVADYSQAIKLDPKVAHVWNNRGIVYCDYLGRPDKALVDFSKAIKLDPKFASAWVNRGNAYAKLGQPAKAVADYEMVLKKLAPAHASAHNCLAWLLATCPEPKLRDPRRAVALAKKAVQLAPKVGDYWGTLGTAQYRAGDWKAAVAALERSRALKLGGDAYAWLFLAMSHSKLGERAEARKCYEQAIEWLEKNAAMLAKNKVQAKELRRFRSEAEEVLELKK
jgi:tetratricopeptide (TPR) repeat protein